MYSLTCCCQPQPYDARRGKLFCRTRRSEKRMRFKLFSNSVLQTNLPVFSFTSTPPPPPTPLRQSHSDPWPNGHIFYAALAFNFHDIACSSAALPNNRRLWYHFKKRNCNRFSFPFYFYFLSFFWAFAFNFLSYVSFHQPIRRTIREGFFFPGSKASYPRSFDVHCIRCFFPNYHCHSALLELSSAPPGRRTIGNCSGGKLNGDSSISPLCWTLCVPNSC